MSHICGTNDIKKPSIETWDNVAETYGIEINEAERELADKIESIFNSLGIQKNASILEVGSGSGHLSGLLSTKGYKTTLLDFSKRALEKSERFFKHHGMQGEFIEGDLMDLKNLNSDFDVVWNSGVMEHFNDSGLIKALRSIRTITNKFFVFLVPNSLSFPYLMFRYKLMHEGNWTYGSEYLRNDYEEVLEEAGFRVVEKRFVGWGLSKDHLDIVFGSSEASVYFMEMIEQDLIPEENAYLTAYIAVPNQDIIHTELSSKQVPGNTEYLTNKFDMVANFNGLTNRFETEISILENTLEQRKCKIESLNDELNKSQSEAERLTDELRKSQSEAEKLGKELIAMSDWAYSMKVRIEDIDKSYLIKFLEKVNQNYIRFGSLFKTEGIYGLTKKIIKKIVPDLMIKGYKKKNNMACYSELEQSVANNTGKVIVVFPIITWGSRWQRPQHILSQYAQNGYTIVYLAMGVKSKESKYNNIDEAGADVVFSKLAENIYKLWLCSESDFNVYIDRLDGGNLNNLYLGLVSALTSLKIKQVYYMVHFPGWSNLVFKIKEKFNGMVIFDCMDDHSGFSTNTTNAISEETYLLRNADLVVATSDLLASKAKKENNNVILVRNGTEYEHFNNIYPNHKMDHLADKPIIGYYGAISDWFDIEIIEYCAKQRPDWNFVLIGSTLGCNINSIKDISNVFLLGEQPYQDLPGYLYYFDVCIIPFKLTPLTMATNPVKFYEYLSCGKPVVSINLPELERYRDYCYLAKDKEEFLVMLGTSLIEKDRSTIIEKRIELARQNSWQERFQSIVSRMEGRGS